MYVFNSFFSGFYLIMPKHADLSEVDLQQMEEGGGLSRGTKKDRDMIYKCFREWVEKNAQITDINLAENTQLETAVCEFFFTLRVTPKVRKYF